MSVLEIMFPHSSLINSFFAEASLAAHARRSIRLYTLRFPRSGLQALSDPNAFR